MSNPITSRMETGKAGELLLQIRFLQYGIQAAPPIIDTGNDLIAVRGFTFKSIQVKSTTTRTFNKPSDTCLYHLLAVVLLESTDDSLLLDNSVIYLIPRKDVLRLPANIDRFGQYELSQALADQLIPYTTEVMEGAEQ